MEGLPPLQSTGIETPSYPRQGRPAQAGREAKAWYNEESQ